MLRSLTHSPVGGSAIPMANQPDAPQNAPQHAPQNVPKNHTPLIDLLDSALNSPPARRRLLQQPKIARAILKDISARQWLFAQWRALRGPIHTLPPDGAIQVLNLIVALMKCSQSLWRGGALLPDIYEEAYAKTWAWFMDQFHTYDPQKASFTTWFNYKLRWMIVEVSRQRQMPLLSTDKRWSEPPAPTPDQWQETVDEWLALVQDNQQLMTCRMREHPQMNCQALLIEILMVMKEMREFDWAAIARVYDLQPDVLERFCKRRCFTHFKAFMAD
ncbi:MAG: hypothetical protein HC800_21170 [Phormidesmis sp. RL_2_1]|nr:hypothetical protein [Phormidesmis sp. RL_2_1]